MENRAHAIVAGLFTLFLGIAALTAFLWLRGNQDDLREYVVVTRQNLGGLNPQAQVRYRGIRIGKVTDIRLDADDPANILVTIAVADDIPLTKGTVAKLSYQGITGIAHILLLDSGRNPEPLTGEGGGLPRITMTPSLMDELGESGMATLRYAQELMAAASATLNEENRRRFAATLTNLEAASSRMAPALENLDGTLVQVRRLLDERTVQNVSAASKELGPLLADARQTLVRLQGAAERLETGVGDPAGGGTAALMPRLNELATDFSLTSRQLSRVLRLLEDSPQGLVFGVPAAVPGPGEPGFAGKEGR
ncbi:MAG: MCE family protein [Betaproteobacteria bacterium]|nr:MCE family protein [Betaproteobacteria bacterium]